MDCLFPKAKFIYDSLAGIIETAWLLKRFRCNSSVLGLAYGHALRKLNKLKPIKSVVLRDEA